MSFGPSGLDRRRAHRVPLVGPGAPVTVVGGRLINGSVFGMLMESPVPLERASYLTLRLVIDGRKYDVETQVTACTPLPSEKRTYGVGLEFVGLRAEVRARLEKALDLVQAALGPRLPLAPV
jgi:Tfp pilus assembly protein PilZ